MYQWTILIVLFLLSLSSCKITSTPPGSLSPFGVHAPSNRASDLAELPAAGRFMLQYGKFKTQAEQNALYKQLDQALIDAEMAGGLTPVISLVSNLEEKDSHRYYVLNSTQLNTYLKFISAIIERYDGDTEYGCNATVASKKIDCYVAGDKMYPSQAFRDMIARFPLKLWQVENEWMWMMVNSNGQPASPDVLLTHFIAVKNAIKKQDPNAKIILGALNGAAAGTLLEGTDYDGYIEFGGGTDCDTPYHAKLSELPADKKAAAQDAVTRTKYMLKNAAQYIDYFDFHNYDSEPQELGTQAKWLTKYMGIAKPLVSLESAGPYFFFPEMGVPPPAKCDDWSKYDPYTFAIQSEHLLKRFAIAAGAGVQSVFYSSGIVTVGWNANFRRLALIDPTLSAVSCTEGKKPAYYTYKTMSEKLMGYSAAIRHDDETFEFQFAEGKSIFVLWRKGNPTIPRMFPIPAEWVNVKVTSTISQPCQKTADSKVLSRAELVSLANAAMSPMFVEFAN